MRAWGCSPRFIAERASLVTSVESYPPAVTDADENLADLDNIDLIEGSVEDVLPELEDAYDAAVIDPPRTGVEPEVLDILDRAWPAHHRLCKLRTRPRWPATPNGWSRKVTGWSTCSRSICSRRRIISSVWRTSRGKYTHLRPPAV